MKTPAEIRLERKVRIELLRMRAAVEREELHQLSCLLLEQAQPKYWLGRLLGSGASSMRAWRWGRSLLSWHHRYALVFSSAWLLVNGLRQRNLRWPTLALLGLRLLRFGVQERASRQPTPAGSDIELAQGTQAVGPSSATVQSAPVAGSLPAQVPQPGPVAPAPRKAAQHRRKSR